MKQSEKGITLIALVVTIIVLIILAGLTISLVLGDNGIITKAKEGKNKQAIAQAREKIEVVLAEASVDKYTNPKYTQNEYLTEMILNRVTNSKVNGDIVISDGYAFTIDRNIPAVVDYAGKEGNLVFPEITTSVTVEPDRKSATINITAKEEKNGIKKIEILQDGFVIQAWEYETNESEQTVNYPIARNGKYTIKVTSSIPGTELVTITNLLSSVTYSPNGSTEWKKEYKIKVATENEIGKIKYQWTDTPDEPDKDTFNEVVEENGIITENTLTGKYYLWTLLEDDSGNTSIGKSELFYFDNTGPTAEITTEWLEEGENNRLKISVSDIKDEHSGMKDNPIKLYITPENGTKQEKNISIENGEGNIIIDGLEQETLTSIELLVTDLLGNVTELKRCAGRYYLVKDSKIVRGEVYCSNEYSTMKEDESGYVLITSTNVGNLGAFTGLMLDLPKGITSLSCNIAGAYRVGYGEGIGVYTYSGESFEIYNPGPVWPSISNGIMLASYNNEIYSPYLYKSSISAEIEGRNFVGFFQCGSVSGEVYQRVIAITDMYLDYE